MKNQLRRQFYSAFKAKLALEAVIGQHTEYSGVIPATIPDQRITAAVLSGRYTTINFLMQLANMVFVGRLR